MARASVFVTFHFLTKTEAIFVAVFYVKVATAIRLVTNVASDLHAF